MKTLYVLVYNDEQQNILTFAGDLPHIHSEEKDTFGAVFKFFDSYMNASCCMMSCLFCSPKEEVWQALENMIPSNLFWEKYCVKYEWIPLEKLEERMPHLKVHEWKKKIYTKNMAKSIAEKVIMDRYEDIGKQLAEKA